MSLVRIGGGAWVPTVPAGFGPATGGIASADTLLLDADEEEVQLIGYVSLAAGSGSKTFGTAGSAISWLPGASITFQATSTLRVGVKKSTTIDNANGPVGRATIGAAAFDVYKDLVGGTDTITSTTWRSDAMASGSGFTVNHGDKLAVCFHLDVSANPQSIKVRGLSVATQLNLPVSTLVTSGPTYTAGAVAPNAIITFDDGTLGWIDFAYVFSATSSEAVGNGNIYANIIQFPFDCGVDAIAMAVAETGTTNFDVGLWSDPAGTPTAMSNGTVSVDPQNLGATASRTLVVPLPAEQALTKNTAYAAGLKQNSASGMTIITYDVNASSHFQPNGLDANSYASKSTAGAAFSAQNSSKRRMACWVRISSVDVSAGGGGANRAALPAGLSGLG